jgi:hypothetical protein
MSQQQNPIYFVKQDTSIDYLCGLYAINNIFQNEILVWDNPQKKPWQIDLKEKCQQFTDLQLRSLYESVFSAKNEERNRNGQQLLNVDNPATPEEVEVLKEYYNDPDNRNLPDINKCVFDGSQKGNAPFELLYLILAQDLHFNCGQGGIVSFAQNITAIEKKRGIEFAMRDENLLGIVLNLGGGHYTALVNYANDDCNMINGKNIYLDSIIDRDQQSCKNIRETLDYLLTSGILNRVLAYLRINDTKNVGSKNYPTIQLKRRLEPRLQPRDEPDLGDQILLSNVPPIPPDPRTEEERQINVQNLEIKKNKDEHLLRNLFKPANLSGTKEYKYNFDQIPETSNNFTNIIDLLISKYNKPFDDFQKKECDFFDEEVCKFYDKTTLEKINIKSQISEILFTLKSNEKNFDATLKFECNFTINTKTIQDMNFIEDMDFIIKMIIYRKSEILRFVAFLEYCIELYKEKCVTIDYLNFKKQRLLVQKKIKEDSNDLELTLYNNQIQKVNKRKNDIKNFINTNIISKYSMIVNKTLCNYLTLEGRINKIKKELKEKVK